MAKSKMKFTPGPWSLESYDYYDKDIHINAPRRKWIASATIDDIERGEGEANARLIAAAPELLEALQAIHRGFVDGSIKWAKVRQSDSDPYHPASTLMAVAINKALGKE